MKVTCNVCTNGLGSDGNPCIVCGGDGEIDLLGSDFENISSRRRLRGMLWDALFTQVADIKDKVDDIFEKVNE